MDDKNGAGVYIGSGTANFCGCDIASNGNGYIRDSTYQSELLIAPIPNSGGGVYVMHTTVQFDDCRIVNNEAFQGGAGICLGFEGTSIVDLRNSAISSNFAHRRGAGIHLEPRATAPEVALTVIGCTISSNRCGSTGGGAYLEAYPSSGITATVFEGCLFYGNWVGPGTFATGGAISARATFTATNVVFDSNGGQWNASVQGQAFTNSPGILAGTAIYMAPLGFVGTVLNHSTFRNHSYPAIRNFGSTVVWGCPLGNWSYVTGDFDGDFVGCPDACPAGRFGDRPDITSPADCPLCPLGHFCNISGLSRGLGCPSGTSMPGVGAITAESCVPCAPGQFNHQSGQAHCTPCGAGELVDSLGASECQSCPSGGYCAALGAASLRQTFTPCAMLESGRPRQPFTTTSRRRRTSIRQQVNGANRPSCIANTFDRTKKPYACLQNAPRPQ